MRPEHYCEKNEKFIDRSSIVSPFFPVKRIFQKKFWLTFGQNFIWKRSSVQSSNIFQIQKIRAINEDEGAFVVFDVLLDLNEKAIDLFSTSGWHQVSNVYYLSQSYFDIPTTTKTNNSNKIISP